MLIYVMAVLASLLVILADDFLKQASYKGEVFSLLVIAAALVYAITAPLWAYVMQTRSLAQVAIMYSMLTLIGLYLLGYFRYNEVPSGWQLVSLGLAGLAVITSEL